MEQRKGAPTKGTLTTDPAQILPNTSEFVKQPTVRKEFSTQRAGPAEVIRNPQDGAVAGIVIRMPEPDSRVFLCSFRTRQGIFWRSREICFDLPVLALAEARGCSWARVELHDQRGQRGWEVDLSTLLLEGRRFTLCGRDQIALPFGAWFYRDLAIIDREEQMATFRRVVVPAKERPA